MLLHRKIVPVFGLALNLLLLNIHQTEGFKFHQDTGSCDDLSDDVCIQETRVFFECPITCSKLLERPGSIARMEGEFFDQSVTRQDGKRMSLEDFEGYVTLYAILPLVPSAQYYYELLEHIHKIFPYTVEILVMPYQEIEEIDKEDKTTTVAIKPHDNPHVTFLQQETRPDLLFYLWESKVYGGEENLKDVPKDRPSIYVISTDGRFVERLISPSLTDLERRIIVYLKQLEQTNEL
jgi:hypothetical protein